MTLTQVPDFPGYYASPDGHVWSTWKTGCKPAPDATPPRLLAPYVHGGGYHQICLRRGRARHKVYVHEVILWTFKGPCPEGKDLCRHLNGNPADNRPENLEWGTAYENSVDTVRHGRSSVTKLTPEQVLEIRARYKKGSGTNDRGNKSELAAEFGVSECALQRCATGATWGHIQ